MATTLPRAFSARRPSGVRVRLRGGRLWTVGRQTVYRLSPLEWVAAYRDCRVQAGAGHASAGALAGAPRRGFTAGFGGSQGHLLPS